MMNRIILIGNGFDLAHGLPTSYKDFIQGYWIFQRRRLLEDSSDRTDRLYCIEIDNPDDIKKLEHFSRILDNSMFRCYQFEEVRPGERKALIFCFY